MRLALGLANLNKRENIQMCLGEVQTMLKLIINLRANVFFPFWTDGVPKDISPHTVCELCFLSPIVHCYCR